MYTWQKSKDPKVKFEKYILRQQLVQHTRNFFLGQRFIEVETPIVKKSLIPESYLEYFTTDLLDRRGHKQQAFLSPSPEASLKKLLVAGMGDCFEITKSFRNTETDSTTHNVEFSMIEWYRVGATYLDIMKDCEAWLLYLAKKLGKKKNTGSTPHIIYKGQTIDLSAPWDRISVTEAFSKYAKMDLLAAFNPSFMKTIARKKGYQISEHTTWEQLYNQIFLNEIEPRLGKGRPTIIYDYPSSEAALARIKPSDPRFAERFEFYIAGIELGDCYSELTDPTEQKKRFEMEMTLRKERHMIPIVEDKEFLSALEVGLPTCSGIAVGLDRVAMLFTDSVSLSEILYYPIE